ncbi:hypothetical protein EZY14_002750 [Kordia sp. TARA_039_SRF]|nr:hypothetical protein EZY14_002750 [Kordia sp. TARA_039_SRF]
MKDIIKNIEIIQFAGDGDKTVALISYQDTRNVDDINNGFNTIQVPVNIREIQESPRGNMLVNQSVKKENDCCHMCIEDIDECINS